jgi:hypothetical protein
MEMFYEDLARQNIVAYLAQLQLWVSALSHTHFSHHSSVLRPLFRTLHGLLGVPALIGLFSPCLPVFNLSVYHFSIDLIGWQIRLPALLFPASPSPFVDSLDSELWYHFGSRAAASTSSSTS